jgi:putative FmdB family regulatory protein
MAIYEFMCDACGISISINQPIDSDGSAQAGNCSNCQIPLVRVWAANPVHFKGKGWGHQ